jgi:hypothetical protein
LDFCVDFLKAAFFFAAKRYSLNSSLFFSLNSFDSFDSGGRFDLGGCPNQQSLEDVWV